MKVKELQIVREDRWSSNPGAIKGHVVFQADGGEQTVTLSNIAMIKLLSAIQDEVCCTAKEIAKAAPRAFSGTVAELELLDHPAAAQIEN